MEIKNVCAELLPVLKKLQFEGFEVYTYENDTHKEILSLYWFENGRMLNIQPSSWYNSKYNRDSFNLATNYHPSTQNGSSCGLSNYSNDGSKANSLLQYRKDLTWVKGYKNYASIEDFVKKQVVLKWYKLEIGDDN